MFKTRREELLRRALSAYAGEHVLSYVLSHGEEALKPAQVSRDLTILFVDVARFKMPVAGLDPGRILEWQTAYLDVVATSVLATTGTLDSYSGDASCSWWDSEIPHHADRACRAALDIRSGVANLNAAAPARGFPTIEVSVGIHRGPAAIGPYGSKDRLRFGILGDAVNLASQLCGIAGNLDPAQIVISDAVYSRLQPGISATKFDEVPARDGTQMALFSLGA
ncbi:hypothetical protein DSM104440_01664 [Usitatibacter palustris]|uniref:Guanylate cyclase domain-containing protein n=2 Tax=Usitatibacter palustris TaxID=2732487 RepID=A0A6M4H5B3_9PROT|nr:hypothetical protein DSM104440_01664 [Usitatibacter palustris]